MTDGQVRRVTDEDGFADAIAVRETVFVEEQGVPEELEHDDHDEYADHFVAYAADSGEPIGAARLREYEAGGEHETDIGKVERVAVLESRRGEGWGKRLMYEVETRARERGFDELLLHAQTPVEGFYLDLDYETTSEEFEEAGIPHVEMRKRL